LEMDHTSHHLTIKLSNGRDIPVFGLGTFLCPPGEVGAAVKKAIEIGYRHIDCAPVYNNEKEIGEALKDVFSAGKVKREDLWITSKLRASAMNPFSVMAAIDKTLADLQLSYLDLYLIHQPVACKPEGSSFVPQRGFGLQEVWRAMETVCESGKARSIGVSNFPTVLVNDLLNYAKIPPVINQIERHPYLVQDLHIKYCKNNGIQITSYGPLGNPGLVSKNRPGSKSLLSDPVISKIAAKHKKTPAQILIRWHIDTGVTVIPKTTNSERLVENYNIWDFKLDAEDLSEIKGLNENLRHFDQDWHSVPTFT